MDDGTRDAINASTGIEMAFGAILEFLLAEHLRGLAPVDRERAAERVLELASNRGQFRGIAPTDHQVQINLLDSVDAMKNTAESIVRSAMNAAAAGGS